MGQVRHYADAALLPIRRDVGDFIGYCGLIVGRTTVDDPEITYELLRSAHERGYATEEAFAVLDRDRDRADTAVVDGAYLKCAGVPGAREARVRARPHPTDDRGELVWLIRDLPVSR